MALQLNRRLEMAKGRKYLILIFCRGKLCATWSAFFVVKLSQRTQRNRDEAWKIKCTTFRTKLGLTFNSKCKLLPVTDPNKWKQFQKCRGIFRLEQQQKQIRRVTAECEFLGAVQINLESVPQQFVDLPHCLRRFKSWMTLIKLSISSCWD